MPAAQRQPAVQAQKRAGNGRADEAGHRDGDHENANDARAVLGRKPVGQIKDDAREKPGLGHAQKKTDRHERDRADRQRHAGGYDAPGDHDPANPPARPKPLQRQITGHFEQEITDEENAAAETEDGAGQANVLVHLQRRETGVGAVDVANQIRQHQKRQQPKTDPPHRPDLQRILGALMLGHDGVLPFPDRNRAGGRDERQEARASARRPDLSSPSAAAPKPALLTFSSRLTIPGAFRAGARVTSCQDTRLSRSEPRPSQRLDPI